MRQKRPTRERVIVCLDVDYGAVATTAALVGFHDWRDASPALQLVDTHPPDPAAYEPGRFFERELPYLLAILGRVTDPLDAIVIDGYVWLGPDRPGLGVHLHTARHGGEPIVGVAKTRFAGAIASPVVRGESTRPLLVTTIGIDVGLAATHVGAMHGPYRIPTLLKRADSLARGR